MPAAIPRHRKTVYHSGRRTLGRQFRLKPDDNGTVRNAVGYMLAHTANQHQITVCAFVHMGSHYHLVSRDNEAFLPEFNRDFHSAMGRYFNTTQDVVQMSLWDNRRTFAQALLDPSTAMEEVQYVLLNPVRAGIVRHPKLYSGLVIGPDDWGKELVFTRPDEYFSENMPEKVTLSPEPPPGFDHIPLERLKSQVRHEVKQKAKEIARNMTFTGLSDVDIFDTPRTLALKRERRDGDSQPTPRIPRSRLTNSHRNGAFDRRKRFKANDRRLIQLALEIESRFQSSFAAAIKELQEGNSEVVFPAGTYALRLRGIVRAQEPLDLGWYPLVAMVPPLLSSA